MPQAEPSEDGRRKRSEASRQRIVAAMVELVGEGHLTPGAERVAQRAGVGLRTVFRHFKDMDNVYAGMVRQLEREYDEWLAPLSGEGWQAQLHELIDRRLATYERLMPYKRAADAHRHASAMLQENYRRRQARARARLMEILPPAISDDPVRLETLDLMLSFETWQHLRLDQALDLPLARAVVTTNVERLAG